MEKKVKVQEVLGSITKNLECSICLDLLNNPVSTKCDHPFCRFCILEFLEKKRSVPCPLCKAPVTKRSLNERPQLNSMVEGVRKLINAFQEDTGSLFSPPRGPHVMNLTPCTPEPLPCKAPRGTKRKIMVSPKATETRQNLRQSKRRKSLNVEVQGEETLSGSHGVITEDQDELLKYLDQGSCGAESRQSSKAVGELSANLKQCHKDVTTHTKQNSDKKQGKTENRNLCNEVVFSESDGFSMKLVEGTNNKSSRSLDKNGDLLKSRGNKKKLKDSVQKDVCSPKDDVKLKRKGINVQVNYSLRGSKSVNYYEDSPEDVAKSPIGKDNNFSFNDSPVTPVHVLQQRGNKSDKHQDIIIEAWKLHDQLYSDGKTETPDVQMDHSTKKASDGNDLSQEKDSVHSSLEFKPKDKTLFEKVERTYGRQKNKPSNTQVISKVNSWLNENITDENFVQRGDNSLEESDCILPEDRSQTRDINRKGRQLRNNNSNEETICTDTSFNTKHCAKRSNREENEENNFEVDNGTDNNISEPLIEPSERVLLNRKQCNENRYENKENTIKSANNQAHSKADQFTEPENEIAHSKANELQPVITQKKRIFKSKEALQTTSVCQKKGVLVIKKVSPPSVNESVSKLVDRNVDFEKLQIGPKDLLEMEADPFEFKSSQKTPVLPQSKRSKPWKKKHNNALKGKLDFKGDNEPKSTRMDSIVEKQGGEQNLHGDSVCADPIIEEEVYWDKNTGDHTKTITNSMKNEMDMKKMDSTESINDDISKQSEINSFKTPILKIKSSETITIGSNARYDRNGKEACLTPADSIDSQVSIIPGSDDGIKVVGKKSRKLSKMAVKINKAKEVENRNKKNMEKLKENINSAEDFDLLLCTQDALKTMDKDAETSQDSVTADLLLSKQRKSVSFADSNVEISGTPRQSRRSVPMLQDRNRGKLLPKETRVLNCSAQKNICPNVEAMEPKLKMSVKKQIPRVEEKKPFVWEEEEDEDTDGTEDLDINPSQDEFEEPSQGIQSTDISGFTGTHKLQELKGTGESKTSGMQDIVELNQGSNNSSSPIIHLQLLENLSDVNNHECPFPSEICVENTQDIPEVHGDDVEDTDIQIVPESVEEEIMMEETAVSHNCKKDNKTNLDDVDEAFASDHKETLNDSFNNEMIGKDKVCFSQSRLENKNNQVHSQSAIQTLECNPKGTQSSVSTIEVSSDSNPVRKSRSKRRQRKTASQTSNMSNASGTAASVILETQDNCRLDSPNDRKRIPKIHSSQDFAEGTQMISVKQCKSFHNEATSDTTSQESVSILIPNEITKSKPKATEITQMKDNLQITIDVSSQSLDFIPGTESLFTEKGLKVKMEPKINQKGTKMSQNTLQESHTSKPSQLLISKKHLKSSVGESAHEVFDSDIELISQHDNNEIKGTPIVISGSERLSGVCRKDKNQGLEGTYVERNSQDPEMDSDTLDSVVKSSDSQDVLTPTLVSQRTLNLRNSAEKKRRSVERQLREKQEQTHMNLSGSFEGGEKTYASPEDIFMMDSEEFDNESQAIPQNPEGIVYMNVEPSETMDSVLLETGETDLEGQVLNVAVNRKDSEYNGIISAPALGSSNGTINEQLRDDGCDYKNSLVNKQDTDMTRLNVDDDQPDKSPPKVRTNNKKKAKRGLARKGKNPDFQNSMDASIVDRICNSIPLNDVKSTRPYRSSLKTPNPCPTDCEISQDTINDSGVKVNNSSGLKSHIVEQCVESSQKFLSKESNVQLTPRKAKDLKRQKMSPTFTYSPQKPKNTKKKLYGKKKLGQSSEVGDQSTNNVCVIGETESDSDEPVVIPNKLESLIKDDIADTEISDEEPIDALVEEKLDFSEDNPDDIEITDTEGRVFTLHEKQKYQSIKESNFSEKLFSYSENNGKRNMKKNQKKVKNSTNQSEVVYCDNISSSLPDISDVPGSSIPMEENGVFSHIRKSHRSKNQDRKKEKKWDSFKKKRGECSQQRAKEDQCIIDLEPSSPLPDLIGDCMEEQHQNKLDEDESEEDDAVLIRSDRINHFDYLEDDPDTVDPGNHGDNSSDENDDVVAIKTKRKRIIDEESDLSDASEDSTNSKRFDNTSSSAFSSQSEPINTQQRNKLESDLARMKREMKEIELQLAIANQGNGTPKAKNNSHTVERVDTIDVTDPDGPDSDIIHEYQSEEELFNSPQPLSPPPLSPQQVDLVAEDTDFTNEFRKHDLELGPNDMGERSHESITQSQISSKNVKNNEKLPSSKVNSKQSETVLVQSSPRLSPVMERKRQKILSPLVNSNKDSRKIQKVLVSTGLVAPQMKELQKLSVLNQCQFTTKFSKDVTHVIVKTDPIGSRVCDRTLKVFLGISQKCWILDYQWVIDSRTAGHLLPEADYEIQGDTVTEKLHYGPKRARESSADPLFTGIQFIVVGNSRGLQRDDLKNLLISCGGRVISCMDELNDDRVALVMTCSDYDDDSQEEDPSPNELKKFKEIYDNHGIISASREWVLDSLTVYRIQPIVDYILTPGSINRKDIPVFDKG